MKGKIVAVCKSVHKGERKANVGQARLIENFGMDGDAHAGPWDTQIRLLAQESIYKALKKGLKVGPGDFSENITTRGIELSKLSVGTKLKLGEEVVLEITQKGKDCTKKCTIYNMIGDCIMPQEGVYAKVLQGGTVTVGSDIKVFLDVSVGVVYLTEVLKNENTTRIIIEETLKSWELEYIQSEKCSNRDALKHTIEQMCNDGINIVFTVGGSGILMRDYAPEVLSEIMDKELPGVANLIRAKHLTQFCALTYCGRAGIRGKTVIVNLPDDNEVLKKSLQEVLPFINKICNELKELSFSN